MGCPQRFNCRLRLGDSWSWSYFFGRNLYLYPSIRRIRHTALKHRGVRNITGLECVHSSPILQRSDPTAGILDFQVLPNSTFHQIGYHFRRILELFQEICLRPQLLLLKETHNLIKNIVTHIQVRRKGADVRIRIRSRRMRITHEGRVPILKGGSRQSRQRHGHRLPILCPLLRDHQRQPIFRQLVGRDLCRTVHC